jgi:hypothetical protein
LPEAGAGDEVLCATPGWYLIGTREGVRGHFDAGRSGGGRAVADSAYLIRYGVMGYVGRFRASPECPGPLGRGQSVVIRTDRGVELGEVLIPLDEAGAAKAQPADLQRVIRPAGPDDLDRSRRAEASRSDRFALCRRVLEDEGWPWDLVDVEPLLEDGVTVIQYLGPHHLDVAAIRARFRMTCDLDVVLEPVGADSEEAGAIGGGCGSGGGCGAGGCGNEGMAESPAEAAGAGCGSSSHGGCASCALSRTAAARRPSPAAAIA